jgi:hypothetical protein
MVSKMELRGTSENMPRTYRWGRRPFLLGSSVHPVNTHRYDTRNVPSPDAIRSLTRWCAWEVFQQQMPKEQKPQVWL